MARFRPRLSYANVVATLALVLAAGGGAYAATQLPANSVGSKQLKANAVTRAKVKGNAINGGKVADDSLAGDDIAESSLQLVPNADHANNADNADDAGTAGHALTADNASQLGGIDASSYLRSKSLEASDSATDTTDVKTKITTCGNGRIAIGGGGAIVNINEANTNKVSIHESYPGNFMVGSIYQSGWKVTAQENTGSGGTGSDDWTLRTVVNCVNMGG
ncbi:MAG TPA: hypothetical protein VJT75_03970 [Thermoleophilaceae bacterium]|nr:hypothetical protein [Thermoleophilaceae bacterium]